MPNFNTIYVFKKKKKPYICEYVWALCAFVVMIYKSSSVCMRSLTFIIRANKNELLLF